MKRVIISLVLVLFACTGASAESFVWRAEKDNSVMYLGGTLHILRDSDYPLPQEFEKAYRASEVVVLETDIGEFRKPSAQLKLLAKAVYSDGSTIDKHLSAKAYKELSAYCAANGIPLQALSRFKPSILITTLTVMELTKLGVAQSGVDEFFYDQAKKDGKAVRGLESVDEQVDFMASMGEGNEDEFVEYSLSDLKTVKQYFETLATAWRKGDAEKLEELLNDDLRAREPDLYGKLITGRNRAWLLSIDEFQKTPQTEFILVGSAHLVGPDGIIEALKRKGYRVDKL